MPVVPSTAQLGRSSWFSIPSWSAKADHPRVCRPPIRFPREPAHRCKGKKMHHGATEVTEDQ